MPDCFLASLSHRPGEVAWCSASPASHASGVAKARISPCRAGLIGSSAEGGRHLEADPEVGVVGAGLDGLAAGGRAQLDEPAQRLPADPRVVVVQGALEKGT